MKDVTVKIKESYEIDDVDLATALLSLARLSPRVESLEFVLPEPDGPYLIQEHLCSLVVKWHSLRRLEVYPPWGEKEAILHLGDLPFLEKLSTVEISHENVELFSTTNGKFPRLVDLAIEVHDEAVIPSFLQLMCRPLCSLAVKIPAVRDAGPDYNLRSSLFAQTISLLSLYHSQSLMKLHIFDARRSPPQNSNSVTHDTAKVLRPLLSLSCLKSLKIISPFAQSVDDSWIAQAAMAWPRLNQLTLKHSGNPQRGAGFTLKGLILLLKGCPHLAYINVRLELKPVSTTLLEGARNSRIRTFWASWGSTLVHPPQVFRALISMFPNLREVQRSRKDSVVEQNWKELNDLLRLTNPIRAEEASA